MVWEGLAGEKEEDNAHHSSVEGGGRRGGPERPLPNSLFLRAGSSKEKKQESHGKWPTRQQTRIEAGHFVESECEQERERDTVKMQWPGTVRGARWRGSSHLCCA